MAFTSVNKNDNFLAWKTGKLIFKEMPMATVTEILSEFYDVNIEIENNEIAYCKFSGQFEGESLIEVLKAIQEDVNVGYREIQDGFILKGKDCS